MYLNNEDTKLLVEAVAALNNSGHTVLAASLQEMLDRLKEIKKKRSDYVNKQNKILRGTYQGD
jgi:hypothetical protein